MKSRAKHLWQKYRMHLVYLTLISLLLVPLAQGQNWSRLYNVVFDASNPMARFVGELSFQDRVGQKIFGIDAKNNWLIVTEAAANILVTGARTLVTDVSVGMYVKDDKLVFAYNDGGTMQYLSIQLNGQQTTWTNTTTFP